MADDSPAAAPDPRDFIHVSERDGRLEVTEDAVGYARASGVTDVYYSTIYAWPRTWIVNPDRTVAVRFGPLFDDTGRFSLSPDHASRFAGKEVGYKQLARASFDVVAPHLDPAALAFAQPWQNKFLHAALYNVATRNPHLRVLYESCPLLGEAVVERVLDRGHEALIKAEINKWDIWIPLPHYADYLVRISRTYTAKPLPAILTTLFDLPEDSNRGALKYLARHLPRSALGGDDTFLPNLKLASQVAARLGPNAIQLLGNLTTDTQWKTLLWYAGRSPRLAAGYIENPEAASRAHERYFTPAHWSTFPDKAGGDNAVVNQVKDFLADAQRAASVEGRSFAQVLRASQHWHREIRDAARGEIPKNNLHFAPSPLDGLTLPARTVDGATYGPFVLRQLVTSRELADEGARMDHCVGTYAARCHDGTSIIFSVQDEAGTHLATAEFSASYSLNQLLREHDYGVSKVMWQMVGDAPRHVEIKEPYTSWKGFSDAHPGIARRLRRERTAAAAALDSPAAELAS